MKKNVILSVIHGLSCEALRPFLSSLRATGSDAHVHLILAGVSSETRQKIESLGITTESFRYVHFRTRRPLMYLWPLWRSILVKSDFEKKLRIGRRLFFFASLRNLLAYDYLFSHQHEFENALVTDSRDVYFQRDPFTPSRPPGLHCYLEAKTQKLGTCPSNRRMVLKAFGPEILAEFHDKPVSCAGTVLGDMDSVLRYLRAMTEELSLVQTQTATCDQAVHNYILLRNKVPNIHIHDNYSDIVFTAGCEPESDILLNDREEIVRSDGQPYAVLHQYDRFSSITKNLLAKLKD